MKWFNNNKKKILIPLILVLALTIAFFANGPINREDDNLSYNPSDNSVLPESDIPEAETGTSIKPSASGESPEEQQSEDLPETTDSDSYEVEEISNDPESQDDNGNDTETVNNEDSSPDVPDETKDTGESKPDPEPEPQKDTCTISISCATVLKNMDECDPPKRGIIPSDGWILKETTYELSGDETVFDVLKNVCRDKKIHLEFTQSTIYNSVYIEGINNLYEFDVGELSGWEYCVNGWYPNYGCSGYKVKSGDVICWRYTCNRGADIGDSFD